jgi:hypothetical protein
VLVDRRADVEKDSTWISEGLVDEDSECECGLDAVVC